MTTFTLAVFLLLSLVGTFLAGLVGLVRGTKAHRASNILLAVGAGFGALVSIAVATGNVSTVFLPSALYPLAVDGTSVSWQLFYGMSFGLDRFSAIFYALVSVITLLVAVYTIPYLERYRHAFRVRNVNVLVAIMVLGMQGVMLSTNIVGFMTFWELMSVASFFIVLADGSAASRQAGFLYLIMTHLGGGAIMAGLFLLSGGALLSDFSVLAMVTPDLPQTALFVALGLLLFGFGSKAGLVPFHVWIPEAYAAAPTHVSALISGTMINVALYGFLRVLLFILPGVPLWFVILVVVLGVTSAMIGVLYAVLERDVKRMLAYSSVENMGIIFTMVGVALLAGQEGSIDLTQSALYAALFLAAAHAVFKTGLFLAMGVVIAVVGSPRLEVMGGLAKRMPQFSLAVCVLVLAGAALPPFAPFVAEWTFVQTMVGALTTATPMLKIALVVVLSVIGFVTGLSLFAMIKLYATGFLAQPRSDEAAAAVEPSAGFMTPVVILAMLGVLGGLFSPFLYNRIGAVDLASEAHGLQVLTTGQGSLAPLTLTLTMTGVIAALLVLRRLVTNINAERTYKTWDYGQPITARMETTATGFSAPIRFFFRFFLRAQKVVVSTPVTPSNPWIVSRSMSLRVHQVWYDKLYAPLGAGFTRLAGLASRLQNGSIQFYIMLIFLTLFVTLIVAL